MMIFKDKKQTQAGCEAFYDGEEEIGTEDHAGYTQAIQPYFLCISLFLFYVKFYLFWWKREGFFSKGLRSEEGCSF